MICYIKEINKSSQDRTRTSTTILKKIRLWLCTKQGCHDFKIVIDEWFDGNVFYDNLADAKPVPLETAQRWCSRHTVLRCQRCEFEWERLSSGVKGCGAHTWIAGQEWPIEYQCLPWDPYVTVRTDEPLNPPPSVLQILK